MKPLRDECRVGHETSVRAPAAGARIVSCSTSILSEMRFRKSFGEAIDCGLNNASTGRESIMALGKYRKPASRNCKLPAGGTGRTSEKSDRDGRYSSF